MVIDNKLRRDPYFSSGLFQGYSQLRIAKMVGKMGCGLGVLRGVAVYLSERKHSFKSLCYSFHWWVLGWMKTPRCGCVMFMDVFGSINTWGAYGGIFYCGEFFL